MIKRTKREVNSHIYSIVGEWASFETDAEDSVCVCYYGLIDLLESTLEFLNAAGRLTGYS